MGWGLPRKRYWRWNHEQNNLCNAARRTQKTRMAASYAAAPGVGVEGGKAMRQRRGNRRVGTERMFKLNQPGMLK